MQQTSQVFGGSPTRCSRRGRIESLPESAELPVPLEPVYLVRRIPIVSDEPSCLERVDQLLRLQVRASQNRRNRCPQLALALYVTRRSNGVKVLRQTLSELIEVDFFRNHQTQSRRDVVEGNVLHYVPFG